MSHHGTFFQVVAVCCTWSDSYDHAAALNAHVHPEFIGKRPTLHAECCLLVCVQDQVRNELASNKVFLQGCDSNGRTVFVVLAKQQEKGRAEETKRFICYTLDNAIAAADPVRNELGQFLCLFDLSGASLYLSVARLLHCCILLHAQLCYCTF